MTQVVTHLLTALAAAATLFWRYNHPNTEKTLERKFFYAALGAQFVWQLAQACAGP